jgi:hypothetical protein
MIPIECERTKERRTEANKLKMLPAAAASDADACMFVCDEFGLELTYLLGWVGGWGGGCG